VALGMAWAGRESDRVSATVIVPASLQQEFGSSLEPVGADAEADPRLSRPVFPMSVIPGGAYSIDELRAYLEKDEVARKSFEEQAERMGDPDLLDHLVVAKVTKPIKMHTQLRQNNKLFWSSDPVTVEPGETGFFSKDTGDLAARGRCGNVMLVTVPEGGVRVPAPRQHQIQSSGGTPPPQQTPPMVLPSSGVRQPQMSMPYQVPAAAAPIVLSMPAAAPPPTVPMMAPAAAPAAAAASSPPPATPYYPPPQIQKSVPWEALLKTGGGDSFPWWAALGGLGGALDLGGKGDVNIVNNNQQKQSQKQKQDQEIDVDIEVIPEPATMLLMAFGLGATGFAARRKRRK